MKKWLSKKIEEKIVLFLSLFFVFLVLYGTTKNGDYSLQIVKGIYNLIKITLEAIENFSITLIKVFIHG